MRLAADLERTAECSHRVGVRDVFGAVSSAKSTRHQRMVYN